jgi:hypothetical protein
MAAETKRRNDSKSQQARPRRHDYDRGRQNIDWKLKYTYICLPVPHLPAGYLLVPAGYGDLYEGLCSSAILHLKQQVYFPVPSIL